MLGQFTSDLLEKEFGKLLKRSGETYLITAQQVLKKLLLQTLLQMNYPTNPALCNTCVVTCNKSVVIKRAKELVTLLMTYLIWRKMFQMMSLVYVAGYANGLCNYFLQ